MKTLTCLLLAGAIASSGVAGANPGEDLLGVYFDTAGNADCFETDSLHPVTTYLLLLNPANSTNGFECTVAMTGAQHFVLSVILGGLNPPDIGVTPYSFAIVCGKDYPVPESGAVVLVTWTIMVLADSALYFFIGPHEHPSIPGGLPVVTGDGVPRLCTVVSGDVNLPVAGINAGPCPVSEEVNSFGAVKSLFR